MEGHPESHDIWQIANGYSTELASSEKKRMGVIVRFDSLHLINNLSVIKGWVFLG